MRIPNISQVDLNLFVVLDAIYSEGGVSRAAEKLHLTQPAISHALARLRLLLGDPLFVRRGQGLIPTPLARNIIGPVRASLQALEGMLNRSSGFAPAESNRRFVVGMRDILEAALLPALLADFAENAPLLDLTSARVARRELEAELESGAVDAALDVFLPLSNNIRSQRLDHDTMVVVARKRHPGLRRGCDLDAYLAQRHVQVTSRPRRLGPEDAELRRRGLRRDIALRCQHYFAACRTVERTNLLLTMPERYARVLSQQFDTRLYPLPFALPKFELFLYWHANVDQDAANLWLRQRILQAFKD